MLFFLGLPGPPTARAQAQDVSPAVEHERVEKSETSFLEMARRGSGPIGVVIPAMSFYLIALVVWMVFQYRQSVAIPDPLVREVSDLLAQKQFTEAYQRLAADPSFLARVLAAGVRKLPSGLARRSGRWRWPTTT